MEPTYQNMTIEHLSGIATDADLQEFRAACAAYQTRTGCSDLRATDYMWGSGDWLRRVSEEMHPLDRRSQCPECERDLSLIHI